MVERRVAYRIVIVTHEGRRPLGTPRKRWEVNIKIFVQDVGWGTWIGFFWLRLRTGGRFL